MITVNLDPIDVLVWNGDMADIGIWDGGPGIAELLLDPNGCQQLEAALQEGFVSMAETRQICKMKNRTADLKDVEIFKNAVFLVHFFEARNICNKSYWAWAFGTLKSADRSRSDMKWPSRSFAQHNKLGVWGDRCYVLLVFFYYLLTTFSARCAHFLWISMRAFVTISDALHRKGLRNLRPPSSEYFFIFWIWKDFIVFPYAFCRCWVGIEGMGLEAERQQDWRCLSSVYMQAAEDLQQRACPLRNE